MQNNFDNPTNVLNDYVVNDPWDSFDSLLASADLKDVTAESAGYDELPDGYYLCEVKEAKRQISKSSGKPNIAFQFKTVQNGIADVVDEAGNATLVEVPKSSNRTIFKYYGVSDVAGIKRFVSDMKKFEGENPGEPFLPEEAFTNKETIDDALDALTGMYIYININTTNKNGQKSTWQSPISWERASKLGLTN